MRNVVRSCSPNAWQCGLWWSTPYWTLEDLMLIHRKVFPQGVKNLGEKGFIFGSDSFLHGLEKFHFTTFPWKPPTTQTTDIRGKKNRFLKKIDSKFC
jgi:hypothetical protein